VAAEEDLHVGPLEAERFDGALQDRNVRFVRAINKDKALGRRNQERREALRADVIDVGDDPVRWKRRRLLLTRADVAAELLSVANA